MQAAWIAFGFAALGAAAPLFAAPCEKHSPWHAVALVELYTSEGCDSCPPAERWLNKLGRDPGALDSAVPLALHVDYWDRLGWPDRFADGRFAERQRTLASLSGSRAIYTPGVFLNLRELRGWSSTSELQGELRKVNARPALVDIRLALEAAPPGQLAITAAFQPKPGAKRPQAFVALYENGLVTEVKAGENRGATLRHDHVVRRWFGPLDPALPFRRVVPLEPDWNAQRLGVAAFVQDDASGEILQATALGVCHETR